MVVIYMIVIMKNEGNGIQLTLAGVQETVKRCQIINLHYNLLQKAQMEKMLELCKD